MSKFENVKPGDIIIHRHYGVAEGKIVQRVTATQITIKHGLGEKKFNKKTGREVGVRGYCPENIEEYKGGQQLMAKKKMFRYRLQGQCFVTQYCQVQYPAKTELPVLTICKFREDCSGHTVVLNHDEVVEATDYDDAIGNVSLSKYEYKDNVHGGGDGLEPTWCRDPKVTNLGEVVR